MSEILLKRGERIQNAATGKTICHVARDIRGYDPISAHDFTDFSEGETPWVVGQFVDLRCIKPADAGGFQIFVEGAWR